ncbi:Putative major facilitator, sugar transporter, major facilitator superfamily [Colletotrichum destructivum]|uniref:Major facilitator, sugar transporter, major facilitator superfamily n=1 Tax=Colletotrichum destructivum TaxID=34406 RepID=A0AAX4I1C3_9PEZI|nr:Putative major facilitator, sugar transporter, major facilitator superfamily [Colletotrichum destructivum]
MGTSLLQKIVKNDAMKEDPPEIYGWRAYALACSACFGGLIFGIDTGVIGGVLRMEEFQELYNLTHLSSVDRANLSANIVSTLQAGCFVGALLAAQAADRYGRRPVLIWAAGGISVIGVVLQAAASGHLAAMYVGRFISGFGTGFASMVNPLYVAENAPRAIRGGLTGIYQLFIVFGIFLSYWINFACQQHVRGTARYMIPLVIQGIPPLLLMISMFLCNESPRHLAKQDKWEEALNVLSGIRALPPDHPYVAAEFAEIRAAIEEENAILNGATWMSLQREMWLVPSNRKRAIISILLMFFQQMTGTNAINYYAPQIFASLGVRGTQNELFATGIYGLVKLIAVAVFLVFVADSLGRRKSLLWTGIGQGSTMLYIGIFIAVARPQDSEDAQVTAAGYIALICVFLFACMFQFGWGPCCWIYVSEIATTRLRATNVSFAAATQWLFNFVISRSVPPMLETLGTGGYGTYIFFCVWCFSMTIFVWFFIPETKGLSLEGMNDLFGFKDDVKHKHADIESSSVNMEKSNGNVTQLEDTVSPPAKS